LIINKEFYAVSFSVPKVSYRNGPLFAVGHDQEAHLILSVSTAFYQVLALRQGSDWHLALSPGIPRTDVVQRQICDLIAAGTEQAGVAGQGAAGIGDNSRIQCSA
jgi:hypothetical protein